MEIADNPRRAIWPLTESSDELLARFENQHLFLRTLRTLGTEQRRTEWLASHLLLRELLGCELIMAHHPNGAPYLPHSSLHMSLSHTKGFVAIVLHPLHAVATDIEYVSDRVLRIAPRFLSKDERQQIDPARPAEHTLLHWCAKETLYKLSGREGLDFRRQLHVHPFPLASSGNIPVSEADMPPLLLHYRLTPSYVWVWSS